MITRKFMDTLVNYQVVNSQEITDEAKIESLQNKDLKKYGEDGMIVFKMRQSVETTPIAGSGCEAGVCPVKTE